MTVGSRGAPPSGEAAHILVVDDDARIRTLLAKYLGRDGFRVSVAADAEAARAQLGHLAFDLAVLDVMMPGESGLDLLAWLRRHARCAETPVLMLTARTDPGDRIGGLETGADDYLGKPFEPRELSLRIRSILRRTRAPQCEGPAETVCFGPFRFHIARGELRDDGGPIRLTERERDILRVLAVADGRPVARESLATEAAGERTVDVQIARLRRKIEPDPLLPLHLQTARGAGYRLICDPMPKAAS